MVLFISAVTSNDQSVKAENNKIIPTTNIKNNEGNNRGTLLHLFVCLFGGRGCVWNNSQELVLSFHPVGLRDSP